MRYLIILLIALLPSLSVAGNYSDAIIECPNGFAPALNEMVDKGLGEFVRVNEDGYPVRLDKLARFYPSITTFDTPAILYIRGHSEQLDLIESKNLTNINILVRNPAYGSGDIYEKLKLDSEATAIYQSYIFHPEFIEYDKGNVIPNLIMQPTIMVPSGEYTETIGTDIDGVQYVIKEDIMIEVPNPKYSPFKIMGRFM